MTAGNWGSLHIREAFHRRRDLMIKLLKEIPNITVNKPEGAFYVFPDVSYYLGKRSAETNMHDLHDLCMYLLYTAHVSTVPGTAFGDDKCIRISYSCSEEDITKAVSRIRNALLSLK